MNLSKLSGSTRHYYSWHSAAWSEASGAWFLIELVSQVRLHRRPFGSNDAVDHSVAQSAVRRNLMVTQNAILFRAQPFDAAPALVIEEMRAELYRDAIELFEC